MTIISLKFENIKEIFATQSILDLSINEKEGEIPTSRVTIPIGILPIIKEAEKCVILMDENIVFRGKITSITEGSRTCELALEGLAEEAPPDFDDEADEFANLFTDESQKVFANLESFQQNKLGEWQAVSMIKPGNSTFIDLEPLIIKDSLKITTSGKDIVSRIDLDVSAAWISRIEGDLDISSKIAKKFSSGKINTLTPQKLLDSWPGFGDKVSCFSNARQTKYFIGRSKLTPDSSMTQRTADIEIDENIQKFSFKKVFFDNHLTLSWGFDQYIDETVAFKIINTYAKDGASKTIRLNLNNVQKYIDNPEEQSFFSSDIGNRILKYISQMIGNYMAISMRNVSLEFEIPLQEDAEFIKNLGPHRWVRINGSIAKITYITYKISELERKISIKAAAFEHDIKPAEDDGFLKFPKIERQICVKPYDVLQDIVVQNEADIQFQKLMKYIEDLKLHKKINKTNYKNLISEFFQENQTKISIVAKPLKTKHCERKIINVEDEVKFS